MAVLNQDQIKDIIPHRDPFLLIDEVVELEPGVRCVALKHLKQDEFWFKGHFPGHPVQPGVLMIEMLAQAGAVCILSVPENKGKIAFLPVLIRQGSAVRCSQAKRCVLRWRLQNSVARSVFVKRSRRLTASERSLLKSPVRWSGNPPCMGATKG